jgi:acetoin utilization protein AcuB
MRIHEIMTRRVETIPPTWRVEEAADLMRQKRLRHLVVMADGKVVGVVSHRDVHFPALFGEKVNEVMSEPAVTIGPNDAVPMAANRMRSHCVSSLPVVERGALVGIVTVADLLQVLGRGVDRRTPRARAALHRRVPHHGPRHAPFAW